MNLLTQLTSTVLVVTVFIYQLPGVLADTGPLVQDLHEFVHLVVAERRVGHG